MQRSLKGCLEAVAVVRCVEQDSIINIACQADWSSPWSSNILGDIYYEGKDYNPFYFVTEPPEMLNRSTVRLHIMQWLLVHFTALSSRRLDSHTSMEQNESNMTSSLIRSNVYMEGSWIGTSCEEIVQCPSEHAYDSHAASWWLGRFPRNG